MKSNQLLPSNNIAGFHIEPTNICTLKCPGCARTQFIQQWPTHWKNHSIDIDQLLNFLDCDLNNKKITLCGNTGDPIYHPDFHRLVRELKQRGSLINLVTNGSYKKQDWWQELTQYLNEQDTVVFSIDGLPENFTQYRINADWESIQVGIETVVASRAQTCWKYIPFLYNQDNIEQAKALSESLGVDEFIVVPSDRFDQHTDHYRPTRVDLFGQRLESQTLWKQQSQIATVNPACGNNREHYISADGFYSPCCYLADFRFYYKTQFGKNKKAYNIKDTTISAIIAAQAQVEFFANLDQQPGCQFNCPNTNEKSNNLN